MAEPRSRRGAPAGPSPKAISRMRPELGLRSSVVYFMLTRLGRHVPRLDLGEEGRKPEPHWAVPGPLVPSQRPSTSSSPSWSRASALT